MAHRLCITPEVLREAHRRLGRKVYPLGTLQEVRQHHWQSRLLRVEAIRVAREREDQARRVGAQDLKRRAAGDFDEQTRGQNTAF